MAATRTRHRNILIIKPGAVGDLLQMTPVIRSLHVLAPDARIDLLVGSEATASLFQSDPHIRETFIFDKTARRSFGALVGLWKRLQKKRYDLVLNFQRSNLKTWFLASAAFPCRVLVYHKSRDPSVHAVENYLRTLATLGPLPKDLHLELYLDPASRAFAREVIAAEGLSGTPLVALNPGASHPVNRWPAERFAELADLIASRMHAKVLIIGGPDDVSLAETIRERSRSRPFSIAGMTSLPQLGAVLERCACVVSGDTGPMHLATAVGTPVVALFGAADPARTGPVGTNHSVVTAPGVSCVPCRSRVCNNRNRLACMWAITAEQVMERIMALMSPGS